jgi:hypothetical protein
MAFLWTGPIENSPVLGTRPAQLVTVKLANDDVVNFYTLAIQGFVLGASRTLYVNELFTIAPNEVLTKNYFADLDAFEFVFSMIEEDEVQVGISVWGKQASGQLVDAHRVVTWEKYSELF